MKKLKKYTVTITRDIRVQAIVEVRAVDEDAAEASARVDAERYPDLWQEVDFLAEKIITSADR